jgi:hypothetical protein
MMIFFTEIDDVFFKVRQEFELILAKDNFLKKVDFLELFDQSRDMKLFLDFLCH